jgi:hypothetical protein
MLSNHPKLTRNLRTAALLALLLTLVEITAAAQTPTPALTSPADLTRVTFYLDDQVLGEVTAPPFELTFVTDNFAEGVHTLHAEGRTAAGETVRSADIPAKFVPASTGGKFALTLLLPILGFTAFAFVIMALMTGASNRKLKELPPGTPRSYGVSGGVICENCGRPFQATPFGINLGVTSLKVQPCPFCGKWGARRRASLPMLRAAEARELETAAGDVTVPAVSEEEQLRRDLDASRYRDN